MAINLAKRFGTDISSRNIVQSWRFPWLELCGQSLGFVGGLRSAG